MAEPTSGDPDFELDFPCLWNGLDGKNTNDGKQNVSPDVLRLSTFPDQWELIFQADFSLKLIVTQFVDSVRDGGDGGPVGEPDARKNVEDLADHFEALSKFMRDALAQSGP